MIEPMQPANLNQQLEKHQSASDSFFLFLPLPSEEELGGVGSLRFKLDATGLGKDVPSTFAIATRLATCVIFREANRRTR